MGRKNLCGRVGTPHGPKHTTSSEKPDGGQVIKHGSYCSASLLFIDDVREDGRSRMNFEVNGDRASAETVLCP